MAKFVRFLSKADEYVAVDPDAVVAFGEVSSGEGGTIAGCRILLSNGAEVLVTEGFEGVRSDLEEGRRAPP